MKGNLFKSNVFLTEIWTYTSNFSSYQRRSKNGLLLGSKILHKCPSYFLSLWNIFRKRVYKKDLGTKCVHTLLFVNMASSWSIYQREKDFSKKEIQGPTLYLNFELNYCPVLFQSSVSSSTFFRTIFFLLFWLSFKPSWLLHN